MSIAGNLTLNSGAEFRGTNTNSPTHTIGGDVIVNSGGTWVLTNGSGSPTYNISGTITNDGSIAAATANGTATINLTGSTPITVKWGTKSGNDHNINIASGKVASFSDDLTIAVGILTVNGILDCGINTITGAGTFTLPSDATLRTGNEDGIAASGATGSVQTTTRNFNTGANYEYNGTTAQSTGNGLPNTVANLIVNNAANVTLDKATLTATTLTMTDGKLILGNSSITATTISGADQNKYIVTDGTGVLTQNVPTSTAVAFPVGISVDSYDPVVISDATTATNFSIKVDDAFANAVNDINLVLPREWDITPAAATTARVALTHDDGEVAPTQNQKVIGRYTAGAWAEYLATYDLGTRTYTSVDVLPGFSPIGSGSGGGFDAASIFPVILESFTVKAQNNQTRLDWATATEQNSSHFLIQRSVDGGRTFATIGQVAGQGDSNERVDYTFVDEKPAAGTNYYRLHQFDYDGTNEFFGPVSVTFAGKGDAVRVWPTLAESELTIETAMDSDAAVLLSVYDLNGRLMQEQIASEKALQTTMSVANLPAGAYFIRWQQGGASGQVRFVKL